MRCSESVAFMWSLNPGHPGRFLTLDRADISYHGFIARRALQRPLPALLESQRFAAYAIPRGTVRR